MVAVASADQREELPTGRGKMQMKFRTRREIALGVAAVLVSLVAIVVYTPTKSTVGLSIKSLFSIIEPTSVAGNGANLFDPHKKEFALQLVASAENSTLDWRAQYAYIEDINDGRGYTAGVVGFCTGCGDIYNLVKYYTATTPLNVLAKYLPALAKIGESATHAGLDPDFTKDWKIAAATASFQTAQDHERDRVYFNPAVNQGLADGLHALGQFIYYDALVMHGPGSDSVSFGGIRDTAMRTAKTPAQGGNETAYLNAFLNAREDAMRTEAAHSDTTRVSTGQRLFLNSGNLNLNPPLSWKVYGNQYNILK